MTHSSDRHPSIAGIGNRVSLDDDGQLDEVVTDGGCHLEHMGGKRWFLSCYRADGSEFAVWFRGKIMMTEERESPGYPWPKVDPLIEARRAEPSIPWDQCRTAADLQRAREAAQAPSWPRADSGVDW